MSGFALQVVVFDHTDLVGGRSMSSTRPTRVHEFDPRFEGCDRQCVTRSVGVVARFRAALRLLQLCLVAFALLLTRSALAIPVACVSASDCDGDGTPNETDTCPAPAANESPQDTILHGFRDVACYRR